MREATRMVFASAHAKVLLKALLCCMLAVAPAMAEPACASWRPSEVGRWAGDLPSTTTGTIPRNVADEFASALVENDVTGLALLNLNRQDLKDLGVAKVGHIKAV